MRYIDSGSRSPNQALGSWLQTELNSNVIELRWQSGFFGVDGLPPFAATLQRLATADLPVHVVIGSNDGETQQAHVAQLLTLIGLPRAHGRLGIVSYAGAYYHPKTYHVRRNDGSQSAYVGSANLGFAGVGALHVEAGLIVDTRQGDPPAILDAIANAVDDWFTPPRAGLESVSNPADVTRLTVAGVLSLAPPPRVATQNGTANSAGPGRPRLQPLIRFPPLAAPVASAAAGSGAVAAVGAGVTLPAVPQNPPYPTYVLFAPGATAPTTGGAAMSGASLPSGYVGLIVRLNRDSSRHWRGAGGTANISIPVPTVGTLRFGLFHGKRVRPRAEYDMEMRYLYPGNQFRAAPASTNVMVYGFTPGDTGHGDVRLVVPSPPAQEIGQLIQQNGRVLPSDGDVAFLEWPTLQQTAFRLSLLERNSPLFQQATALLTAASASNQLVGQGACWLPPSLSPTW